MSTFFDEAKEQILRTVEIFRTRGFISTDKKVHAIVSFPRNEKRNFHNQLVKQGERQEYFHKHKIILKGDNHIKINSLTNIS